MFKRKPVLNKALLRLVAVNFFGSEGSFVGHLSEFDAQTYVLEQCETIPDRDGVVHKLPGRHYVDRKHCWLQEMPT